MIVKIHKFITRELLILLGTMLFSCLVLVLAFWIPTQCFKRHLYVHLNEAVNLSAVNAIYAPYRIVREIAIAFIFIGYPFTWFIRFIIWAIRTLKEKN